MRAPFLLEEQLADALVDLALGDPHVPARLLVERSLLLFLPLVRRPAQVHAGNGERDTAEQKRKVARFPGRVPRDRAQQEHAQCRDNIADAFKGLGLHASPLLQNDDSATHVPGEGCRNETTWRTRTQGLTAKPAALHSASLMARAALIIACIALAVAILALFRPLRS